MSSTQTESETGVMPAITGFKMERTESETEPRLGRSLYRNFGNPKSQQSANDRNTAEPVPVLLHVDDGDQGRELLKEPVDAKAFNHPTDFHRVPLMRTPSIPIAMTPGSRNISGVQDIEENTPTGIIGAPTPGKAKRKKKANKKVPPTSVPEPAMQTVRGFTPTRVPSSDGDSDLSPHRFPCRDISISSSLASSPLVRPVSRAGSVTGGISALRQQLDALELEPVPGNPAAIRNKSKSRPPSHTPGAATGSGTTSDVEPLDMESYEVPLENDFVSKDAEDQEYEHFSLQMDIDVMHRKMTAADFTPLTCLGKGSFGTVHLVKQNATGRLFAQKMFRKASITVQKTLIEQTKTERVILESINRHPFVVKLYYAFQDQEKLYLILEYAQGGELFTHLATERMFSEDTASFYMAEMVLALEHLHHTVGVVYRDLKPENCLLDSEGHLLLTDFGLSKVAVEGADTCNSILGTFEYMAPEVVLGQTYDKAVDWWSFGALLFDLLTGSPPFQAPNHTKLCDKIIKSKLVMPYFLSPDAKDLLTRLLRKEPRKRLGANMPKDMTTIKKHRFFRKIDWNKLEKRELEPPIRPLVTDPELAENFATEFTGLALSPVAGEIPGSAPWDLESEETNPFGGFSFVANTEGHPGDPERSDQPQEDSGVTAQRHGEARLITSFLGHPDATRNRIAESSGRLKSPEDIHRATRLQQEQQREERMSSSGDTTCGNPRRAKEREQQGGDKDDSSEDRPRVAEQPQRDSTNLPQGSQKGAEQQRSRQREDRLTPFSDAEEAQDILARPRGGYEGPETQSEDFDTIPYAHAEVPEPSSSQGAVSQPISYRGDLCCCERLKRWLIGLLRSDLLWLEGQPFDGRVGHDEYLEPALQDNDPFQSENPLSSSVDILGQEASASDQDRNDPTHSVVVDPMLYRAAAAQDKATSPQQQDAATHRQTAESNGGRANLRGGCGGDGKNDKDYQKAKDDKRTHSKALGPSAAFQNLHRQGKSESPAENPFTAEVTRARHSPSGEKWQACYEESSEDLLLDETEQWLLRDIERSVTSEMELQQEMENISRTGNQLQQGLCRTERENLPDSTTARRRRRSQRRFDVDDYSHQAFAVLNRLVRNKVPAESWINEDLPKLIGIAGRDSLEPRVPINAGQTAAHEPKSPEEERKIEPADPSDGKDTGVVRIRGGGNGLSRLVVSCFRHEENSDYERASSRDESGRDQNSERRRDPIGYQQQPRRNLDITPHGNSTCRNRPGQRLENLGRDEKSRPQRIPHYSGRSNARAELARLRRASRHDRTQREALQQPQQGASSHQQQSSHGTPSERPPSQPRNTPSGDLPFSERVLKDEDREVDVEDQQRQLLKDIEEQNKGKKKKKEEKES